MKDLDLWGLRLAWVVQPFTLGPLIGDALSDSDQPLRSTASIAAWVIWAAVLVALLIPRAATLTVVRIAIPAAVPAAIWAAVARGDVDGQATLGVALAVAAASLAMLPTIGTAFVDGSSYGDEQRFPLRAPAPLLLGPIELAWAVAVAGFTLGPLALLDQRWLLGAISTAIGLPAAVISTRALHQLTRRWVVFVPAGMVLADPSVLREPVLFPRTSIATLGPAPADTDADDLTNQAPGLALRLAVEPATSYVLVSRTASPEPVETGELLFTPTRPGAVLRTAVERKLRVG